MTDEDTAVPTGARLVARGHPRVWGSEALLEIALGAGHMGTWWWDRETGAGAWSDAQFRLFGYRPGEVPVGYATMLALVVPEDRARFEAVCREVFERGEVELEFRIRRHGDGAERCIFGRGRALDDRYVVGVNIDVTERKRFEARLRESEARLQLALAAGGMGVWDWDLDTDTIHWSDGTYALLGLPSQTSASLPLFFDMVLDDDRAALQAAIARARETGCYAHELRLRRADGRVVWLAAQGAVHTDENGGKRLIGATFDISTRKAAEADRERASQRKDEFLAMLAHELRNPLAAIAAAASMLPDTAADARTSAAAGIIRRQAQHLGRLVGDLVDLALIDRARIELRRESTDVLAAVRQALEQVQPAIAANRQSVALAAPAAPVHVLGDPTRLAQVFANLLSNAAKYSPPGARIDLVVASRGSTVEIAVEDSGPGIAPEMLPHVFEPFTQGPRTLDRAEGGLGLGLAIVKSLVELHGGSVAADAAASGAGARFSVRLPTIDARDSPAAPAAPGGTGASRRVLVVDDNADAAESLAMLLELSGHTVATALDGETALAVAARFAPEVALLDIGLPGMDGYALARALRGEPAHAGLKLVALTGYGQPQDRERSRAAGFDHHLVKPVDEAELARCLGEGAPPRG